MKKRLVLPRVTMLPYTCVALVLDNFHSEDPLPSPVVLVLKQKLALKQPRFTQALVLQQTAWSTLNNLQMAIGMAGAGRHQHRQGNDLEFLRAKRLADPLPQTTSSPSSYLGPLALPQRPVIVGQEMALCSIKT